MSVIILGVGGLGVSRKPGDVIKTLALGSCIAVISLEPLSRTVGMVHVALPESKIDEKKAVQLPGYFADTGVAALINEMKLVSGVHNERSLLIKMVGGAKLLDPNNAFNIGKRNELAIKKSLWSYGMGAQAEDIGGTITRSVLVEVDTGRVIIVTAGRETWEI